MGHGGATRAILGPRPHPSANPCGEQNDGLLTVNRGFEAGGRRVRIYSTDTLHLAAGEGMQPLGGDLTRFNTDLTGAGFGSDVAASSRAIAVRIALVALRTCMYPSVVLACLCRARSWSSLSVAPPSSSIVMGGPLDPDSSLDPALSPVVDEAVVTGSSVLWAVGSGVQANR